MPILIFLAISLVAAVTWHRYCVTYLQASLGAAISSVVLFQIVAALQLGYLEKFALIAVMVSFPFAILISLLVGLPIRARRKKETIEKQVLACSDSP